MYAYEVFDKEKFFEDVIATKKKWKCSYKHIAREAGVTPSQITFGVNPSKYPDWQPTLATVVRLAKACDLDLNRYIK